jgi:toxin ParE1/3/4
MPNYALSGVAREDIDELLLFIAADDLNSAIAFNLRLEAAFLMLGNNPKAGRERPELNEGLRSFPIRSYLVFYRIWAGKVTITRVLHSARDLDEIFS